ncbi:class I SAM-dependent DNA methyltransferase [Rhodocyclus purpureus]|uniref:class I SAM-dependent DNA methyltransferase n=1 Tax=Rhodocyclus purpureus TaxID=1067 RepID=UPI001914D251|nr:class I SAM-dependent DNA methyltransferase [Rhodocyclus purpureus]MBK5913278.1 SAM-dependent methyltransferase [Rhodocyclus purpureus]
MTPQQFIEKWRQGGVADGLSERAGAQAFFLDLCELLDQPKPADPDNYCFERGAQRTGAGRGWADVWKRFCFAWENKAPGADLARALQQLMTYALALDNPPLLVVSDRRLIVIHTHFTGAPSETHTIRLEDIGTPENLDKLRWLFEEPERFRPLRDNRQITEDAARAFAELAQSLRTRFPSAEDSQRIAHFLTQCLFCLFAEDAELLPRGLFERLLDKSRGGDKLDSRLRELFAAMRDGGDFALEDIAHFNGGLFAHIDPLPLSTDEADILLRVSRLNWNAIDPAIFGTLFERGLDPQKRGQLGAHYTDPDTIMRLVEPVIVRPLAAAWEAARADIAANLEKSRRAGDKAQQAAQARFQSWLERLKNYRVLDAACGSGNFLYLALKALKDIEHKANLDAEALGLQRPLGIETSPTNVLGIEINEYAAELARVTVWIGELQWMRSHGYPIRRNPILETLERIENRDALMNADGSEADWPDCDAIVGNPPFIGDKMMRGELGADYVERLRRRYDGRVPGGADFVTYWFEKARAQIAAGKCAGAGLVATNSIRGGANRKVLDRIVDSARIFEAWSDEPWVNEGAAVRVSLVCFGRPEAAMGRLDGKPVDAIHADLTAGEGLNLATARALPENANTAYLGIQKTGPFDIPGELARHWLKLPNPHGRPNSEVVKPWFNGLDVTRRNRDYWIVDFGTDTKEADAALFETPFAYLSEHVLPERAKNHDRESSAMWWLFHRPRPNMRQAISGLPRFIATPEVSKHRVFVWLPSKIVADKNLVVVARADDVTFGILHSRFHELWALRLGTSLEDRPRYTSSTTFETFPFPEQLTPRGTACWGPGAPICDNHEAPPAPSSPCAATETSAAAYSAPTAKHAQAIASAARRLDELRENWLNPPEWVDWVITPEEEKAGFPQRPVAKPGHEADLKKRTLTNLYNARPTWLAHAHRALDAAVAAAYGWTDYSPEMPDEEILRRLLALNLARSAAPMAD